MNSPFAVLYVGRGRYAPGQAFGPSRFPHCDFFTLWEGAARLWVGKRGFELFGGDAVLIPPGHRFHGIAETPGAQLWVAHFRGSTRLLTRHAPKSGRPPLLIRGALAGEFERRAARRLFELHEAPEAKKTQAARDGLLTYLLAHAGRTLSAPPRASGRKRRFEELLEQAAGKLETGLGVRELARQAGLSESYFRATFCKLMGTPPDAALREIRHGEARRLLAETTLPIKAISTRVGYGDVCAFHRAFRKALGKTPADYRSETPTTL